ncbi:EAL domain-containing protein [Shewanella sp. Scap07]|uniref:EAL domain-containing protein n=1 Tax=Shewanella sp. Scap07 TaxID=2589987 RepID=UPI0015BC5EC3|nr:EAL domain-containing protein [Shewanella sp. Scap07]QLE85435.1 EAL domain-containing protein [Shewanella sp. Scap07]
MKRTLQLQEIEATNLKIVSEFAVDLLTAKSVDDILWHVAQNVVSQLGLDDIVIYLLDSDQQHLVQKATFGNKNPVAKLILSPIVIPLNTGIVGKAARERVPIRIGDTRLHPEYIVDDEVRLSELAVPMLADGKVIGVIDSEHPQQDFYTKQHERTVFALASIAAVKIQKLLTLQQLQRTVEELEYSSKIQDSLFEIAEIIFETDSMSGFYQKLHRCIGKLTFAKNFYVGLLDNASQTVSLPYYADEFDTDVQGRTIPLHDEIVSITSYVLKRQKPLLVTEAQIGHLVQAGELTVEGTVPKAWLGVPFGDDSFSGIVVVQSYSDTYLFTDKDMQLLVFVAKHIRNAIERKNAKSKMEFLALHDPLTKLPNRLLFADRISHAIDNIEAESILGIAVCYLDLDRFKQINDNHGHHIGDQLLVEVSRRINACLRKQDTLCRLGGDEFAILIEDIFSVDEVKRTAEQILTVLNKPIKLGDIEIVVSVSIGIAEHFYGGDNTEQLLVFADEAMYQAKLKGRGQVYCFDDSKRSQTSSYKLETEFNQAVKDKQLFLVYQPLVDLDTGTIYGAEALIRWQHPELGEIPPARFLPEFERAQLMGKLDNYVVKAALAFLSEQEAQFGADFKLSINISGEGFNSRKLIARLNQYFAESPKLLKHLAIEITEQTIVSSVEETKDTIERLRQMGISISLDDFGTGYSSLSYLQQYTFDSLKIDRSFISHMEAGEGNQAILDAILSLAKTLDIATIAEGVETQHQYTALRNMDCQYAQGYFMSKPINQNSLLELLQLAPDYGAFNYQI